MIAVTVTSPVIAESRPAAAPRATNPLPVAVIASSSPSPTFGHLLALLSDPARRRIPTARPASVVRVVRLAWEADESPTEVALVVPLFDATGRIVG